MHFSGQHCKYAPTILFIDEIDAIGKNRQSAGDSNSRADILNALLTEMSGFKTTGESRVFVLAATNFDVEGKDRFSLDSALLRRFDRKILVDLPNREERLRFLKQRGRRARRWPSVMKKPTELQPEVPE